MSIRKGTDAFQPVHGISAETSQEKVLRTCNPPAKHNRLGQRIAPERFYEIPTAVFKPAVYKVGKGGDA